MTDIDLEKIENELKRIEKSINDLKDAFIMMEMMIKQVQELHKMENVNV